MYIKRFHPLLDGFEFPYDWDLRKAETGRIQTHLDSSLQDVLTHLRQTYRGSVEVYEIEPWLKSWLEIGLSKHSFLNTGLLYAVLDHYYARHFSTKKFKKSNSKGALKFRAYLVNRIFDSLRANTAEQLKALAISEFMPDSWVQEAIIKNSIKKEIKSIGVYSKSEVEFDLRIPQSGKHWFQYKSIEEWKKLKSYLDKCKPQPITYVTKTNGYSHFHKTVIAYDYNQIKQNVIEILTYDLTGHIALDRIRLQLQSSRTECPGQRQVEGFYLENYKPAPVPKPLWLRIFHFMIPSILIWYVKRVIFFINQKTGKLKVR